MDDSKELLKIADRLDAVVADFSAQKNSRPVQALQTAAVNTGKAWSGSWLGYHANVYYEDLKPPPAGANFSPEWGLMETNYDRGTTGLWKQYNPEAVINLIYRSARNPSLKQTRKLAAQCEKAFAKQKSNILAILAATLNVTEDPFLEELKSEVTNISLLSKKDAIDAWRPSGDLMSRDSLAYSQGFWTPPHLDVLADVTSLKTASTICEEISTVARKAGSYLARMERRKVRSSLIGTNVFIGHGNSTAWRELKDFVQDRLQLPYDEFNRVPIAGITNVARLSEMLEAASIGFLVLTGEDEQADGKKHARMNVIHEAGLFQGRLGFNRAIIVLEEGCEEFSNIEGLGQIRFPKGRIKAAFEDIRGVLEREGIIKEFKKTPKK